VGRHAQTYFNLRLICAGCTFIAQWPGGPRPPATSPKPGQLSMKLFFPYCDAICDSTADARQFERVTS